MKKSLDSSHNLYTALNCIFYVGSRSFLSFVMHDIALHGAVNHCHLMNLLSDLNGTLSTCLLLLQGVMTICSEILHHNLLVNYYCCCR